MTYQAGHVVEVTTVDVAHGGWCVARPDDGPVVFVRHALPGETVLARITEVTSRLARAEAVEILTPSPDRVEPPCLFAHPALNDLGLTAQAWPGAASVEALVAPGSGERAVIITPGRPGGPERPGGRARSQAGALPPAGAIPADSARAD